MFLTPSQPQKQSKKLFRQATFYLAELFHQANFYLAELSRQIGFS